MRAHNKSPITMERPIDEMGRSRQRSGLGRELLRDAVRKGVGHHHRLIVDLVEGRDIVGPVVLDANDWPYCYFDAIAEHKRSSRPSTVATVTE